MQEIVHSVSRLFTVVPGNNARGTNPRAAAAAAEAWDSWLIQGAARVCEVSERKSYIRMHARSQRLYSGLAEDGE